MRTHRADRARTDEQRITEKVRRLTAEDDTGTALHHGAFDRPPGERHEAEEIRAEALEDARDRLEQTEVPQTPVPDRPMPGTPGKPEVPEPSPSPAPDPGRPGVPEPAPPDQPEPGAPEVPEPDPKGPETPESPERPEPVIPPDAP